MIRYTGEKKNKGRHDDIPDAMSYLCFFLPASSLVDGTDPKEMEEMIKVEKQKAQLKANYDRIYGRLPSTPNYSPSKTESQPSGWRPAWPTR
jgi:hypothetical protein